MDKKILKGTRWLLLKNPENLDESKKEFFILRIMAIHTAKYALTG
jgi:hypothetical protein